MPFHFRFHVDFRGHEWVGHRLGSEASRAKAEQRQLPRGEFIRDWMPVKHRRMMKPRRTDKQPSAFICRDVPYISQPPESDSCWHASFNMVNRREEHARSSYAGDTALFENDEFRPIPHRRLRDVLAREGLVPVPACGEPEHKFTAAELAGILTAHGPIAFAWRPEYNQFFRTNPGRYHWSVMIDADTDRNEIVYHDPIANRESHAMSIDEFNRQRARDHDHTMVRRAGPADCLPERVQFRQSATPPARRGSTSLINRLTRAVRRRDTPVVPE